MCIEQHRVMIEGNKAVVKGFGQPKITIPSLKFMVGKKSEIKYFDSDNTTKCTDKEIIRIFDRVKPKQDNSIDSVEELYTLLVFSGISKKRLQFFTGWVFHARKDLYPTFKAFLVIDGNQVFDFLKECTVDFFPSLDTEVIGDTTLKYIQMANSEKYGCGQIAKDLFYIGSECTPKQARNMLMKMKDYKGIIHGLDSSDKESFASMLLDGMF